MANTEDANYGKLTISDGGLAGARRCSAEVSLERAIRARFVAMRGKNGKVPGRAFYEIACGAQNPWRVLARRIREARRQRVPREQVDGVIREIDNYVAALYGKQHDTGDFPAAA